MHMQQSTFVLFEALAIELSLQHGVAWCQFKAIMVLALFIQFVVYKTCHGLPYASYAQGLVSVCSITLDYVPYKSHFEVSARMLQNIFML
jgi:hypothetical protein